MPPWWQPHQQERLPSCRHICFAAQSRLAVRSRASTPEGSQPAFAVGYATPIWPITGQLSLAPSSFTRCPVRSPYDSPCCRAQQGNGITTFRRRNQTGGLGRVSPPVVRHLRRRSSEPPNLTTCLLAQAYQHLWLVLCDDVYDASPGLTMPPYPRPRPP